MAHAGLNIYGDQPQAFVQQTGEIEIALGVLYVRMKPDQAAELARQIAVALEALAAKTAAALPALSDEQLAEADETAERG